MQKPFLLSCGILCADGIVLSLQLYPSVICLILTTTPLHGLKTEAREGAQISQLVSCTASSRTQVFYVQAPRPLCGSTAVFGSKLKGEESEDESRLKTCFNPNSDNQSFKSLTEK